MNINKFVDNFDISSKMYRVLVLIAIVFVSATIVLNQSLESNQSIFPVKKVAVILQNLIICQPVNDKSNTSFTY